MYYYVMVNNDDKARLEQILTRVKTPCYVLDLDRVKENIQMIKQNITYPNFQIHYAMFSNDNIELLKLIKSEDIGILVLNENEYETAIRLGFAKKNIHLNGGTFGKERLRTLLSYGIDINLDSLAQLELVGQIAKGSAVGIRLRLYRTKAKGSGEGIALNDLQKALKIARKHKLKIVGLQTYIGTNTLNEQKYVETARILTDIAPQFQNLRYINLGGGFGIPYSFLDKAFDWSFGKEITKIFQTTKRNKDNRIQLKIEPGRSIIGDAGYFVTQIIELRDENTLVVDAPYTNFSRPFVYHTNHRVNCIGKEEKEKIFKIRGCTINSADYLSSPDFEGDNAILSKDMQIGDILYFRDVGAYSPVMQMDFLHNEKAQTALIKDGKITEKSD